MFNALTCTLLNLILEIAWTRVKKRVKKKKNPEKYLY